MTREQLIKAIDENEDAWSCPEYACNMPEEEGNTGECCRMCAEKQLKAYEDRIKEEASRDFLFWLWCERKIDRNIWETLDDYIDEWLKEQNNE